MTAAAWLASSGWTYPGQAADPHAIEIVVAVPDDRRLAGTLTLPEGRPPFPVALTLTGSGAHYRDGNRSPNPGKRKRAPGRHEEG